MSIECGICERDLRGEHDEDCPRHSSNIIVRLRAEFVESRRREAELQEQLADFKRSALAFAENSRVHASSARQLTARAKTLEDALRGIQSVLVHTPQVGYKNGKAWTAREEALEIAGKALAAKEPKV